MSSSPPDYLSAVDEVLTGAAYGKWRSPAQLLGAWESVVDECIHGYHFGWDELANDVSVRGVIEKLLTNGRVRQFPQAAEFASRVAAVDERYQSILRPVPDLSTRPWWMSHVPAHGGEELADDVRRIFGIEIERRE